MKFDLPLTWNGNRFHNNLSVIFPLKLEARNVNCKITDSALDLFGQMGYSVDFGVRPLKRAIVNQIENKLFDMLLSGKLKSRNMARIDAKDGLPVVERVE
jgi:ATP-dependent Clp protease ATP-binding subunit ClpA